VAANSETYFAVNNLTKSFGGLRAVDDVTFSFTEGKLRASSAPTARARRRYSI
jgi:ABC-type branched-subunit amino acid transport system ATPase component